MDSILKYCKYLLRSKTSQKSLLKILCYNNKVTKKVKDFQKFTNEEIYFTLQSNSTKYNKPFSFISWPNFLEEHHFLSSDIWGKTFTDRFKKSSDRAILFSFLYKVIHFFPLNPATHRMGNTTNIECRRCKKQKDSQPYFTSFRRLSKITLDFISELINLKYALISISKLL